MKTSPKYYKFNQLHIDLARTATSDFNLFHDSDKWLKINHNPFKGPIVLGFQLVSLIEHEILLYRKLHNENNLISESKLRFSNYQFSFVNAVKPEQVISVNIKESHINGDSGTVLSNKINIKTDETLALLGYKKESQLPLFLPDPDVPEFDTLKNHPDCSYLYHNGNAFFLKRKYIRIDHAKNFLMGSLSSQLDSFDDLQDTPPTFPEIFPCSLISCALLEKAIVDRHDFEQNPMVYLTHKISVDRLNLARLKSNDELYILIKQIPSESDKKGLKGSIDALYDYECYGIMKDNAILYRALISLATLEKILKSLKP